MGAQGADLHDSGELCAQKIQRNGGDDTGGKQQHDHPQPHPNALDMVVPVGAVLLPPLDSALLLLLLLGLLFHGGGQDMTRPVLSSHSANRGMPRILVSMEASFFPS